MPFIIRVKLLGALERLSDIFIHSKKVISHFEGCLPFIVNSHSNLKVANSKINL
jgi:hypothetical protein